MNKETLTLNDKKKNPRLSGIPHSHSKLGNPFKRDHSFPFIDLRGEAQYNSGKIPFLLFKGEHMS